MRAQPRALIALGALAAALGAAGPRPARAACAVAPGPEVPARVERRMVEKAGRIELSLGGAYLLRGDFYRNPGLQMTLGYWVREPLALELQVASYFASESDEARAVREETGFLPDSRRERATVALGARWSFAYGKALLGSRVLRFDPQLFAHAGVHFTDGQPGPLGDFGFALAAWPTGRVRLALDLGLVVEGERRSSWVAVLGLLPTLSLGVLL